jgi:hypothetical protein
VWAFVGWIGLVCELGGIVVALWGLDELSSELFPGRPLPHKAAWRWTKRRVLRIKPNRVTVQVHPATLTLEALPARVYTTKARPSDGAPLSQWNEYWDSRLKNLSDQITWVREDMKKEDDSLARRLKDENAERHTAVAQLEERLTSVVGGEGGRGLARTWWGFAVTAFGVLLQGLG